MCIHQLSKEIFNHYGRYSRNQGLSTLILNIYVVQGCQSNILCRCIRIIIGNMFINPPSLWRTGRFTTPCHKKVLLYIILCSTLPTHKLNVHIFSHLSLLLFVSFFCHATLHLSRNLIFVSCLISNGHISKTISHRSAKEYICSSSGSIRWTPSLAHSLSISFPRSWIIRIGWIALYGRIRRQQYDKFMLYVYLCVYTFIWSEESTY